MAASAEDIQKLTVAESKMRLAKSQVDKLRMAGKTGTAEYASAMANYDAANSEFLSARNAVKAQQTASDPPIVTPAPVDTTSTQAKTVQSITRIGPAGNVYKDTVALSNDSAADQKIIQKRADGQVSDQEYQQLSIYKTQAQNSQAELRALELQGKGQGDPEYDAKRAQSYEATQNYRSQRTALEQASGVYQTPSAQEQAILDGQYADASYRETLKQNESLEVRNYFESERAKANTGNAQIVSDGKKPLVDAPSTYNNLTPAGSPPPVPNAPVTVNQPTTYNSNIAGTPSADLANRAASTNVMSTDQESAARRKAEYDRNAQAIAKAQADAAGVQARIDANNELIKQLPPDDPRVQSVKNTNSLLQTQLQAHQTAVATKQNIIDTMKQRDSQDALRSSGVLKETRAELDQAYKDRKAASDNVIAAEKDLSDAVKSGDQAAIADAKARMVAAGNDYSKAESTIADKTKERDHIIKLSSDPEYFRQQEASGNIPGARVPDPSNPGSFIGSPSADEETIPPPNVKYGLLDSGEKTNLPPNKMVYDTYTGELVPASAMEKYEPDGAQRYAYTRPSIDIAKAEADEKARLDGIEMEYDKKIRNRELELSEQANNEILAAVYSSEYQDADSKERINKDIFDGIKAEQKQYDDYLNGEEWKGPLPAPSKEDAAEILKQLQNEESVIQNNLDDARAIKEGIIKPINDAAEARVRDELGGLQAEKDAKIGQVPEAFKEAEKAKNEPVTPAEARALKQQLDVADEKVKNAERKFELDKIKADEATARTYAVCGGARGSPECAAAVAAEKAANDKLNDSWKGVEAARADRAAALNAIGNASGAPGGKSALEGAGLTPDKIKEAADKDKAFRENPAGVKTGLENSARDPNVGKKATGFEGLADGTPFYFQMPTMQAITDFRLKNGFSPYGPRGNDEIARDAVHFSIFEMNPPVARAEASPDGMVTNKVDDNGTNTIGTFTVYPNNPDWLSMNHQHSWTAAGPGVISNLANTVFGAIDTAQDALLSAKKGLDSYNAGKEVASDMSVNRKLDVLKTYQSTTPLTFSIPFNLFTKKDFLNDVYRPLMLLTAISYPKRLNSGDIVGAVRDTINSANAAVPANDKDGKNPQGAAMAITRSILDTVKDALNSETAKTIQSIEKDLSETGGYGPFRYFVTKKPEYLSMRHASGLVYFPMCFITSISYTFKGPWYNYDGQPISNATLRSREDDLKFEAAFNSKNFARDWNKRSIAAYPSIAECTITVENALPFFRDDWMQLYFGAANPQDLINVSVRQTGQGKLISPDGKGIRPPAGTKTVSPTAAPAGKDAKDKPKIGSEKPEGAAPDPKTDAEKAATPEFGPGKGKHDEVTPQVRDQDKDQYSRLKEREAERRKAADNVRAAMDANNEAIKAAGGPDTPLGQVLARKNEGFLKQQAAINKQADQAAAQAEKLEQRGAAEAARAKSAEAKQKAAMAAAGAKGASTGAAPSTAAAATSSQPSAYAARAAASPPELSPVPIGSSNSPVPIPSRNEQSFTGPSSPKKDLYQLSENEQNLYKSNNTLGRQSSDAANSLLQQQNRMLTSPATGERVTKDPQGDIYVKPENLNTQRSQEYQNLEAEKQNHIAAAKVAATNNANLVDAEKFTFVSNNGNSNSAQPIFVPKTDGVNYSGTNMVITGVK